MLKDWVVWIVLIGIGVGGEVRVHCGKVCVAGFVNVAIVSVPVGDDAVVWAISL
jgi:hypothetical protein